jgi:hypothetical protein
MTVPNATAPVYSISDLVNLETYPLHEPQGAGYRLVVQHARTQLAATGCALNKDFIHADGLRVLGEEIWATKPDTHYSTQKINPYFHTETNANYPLDHPVNTFTERSSGFIPGDSWAAGCATDVLFREPTVARFLADCLGLPALYCYADPLAGLTSNILDPGQQFAWHFDTNEFAVTVLVEEADSGGLFEYYPGIRSADDEGFTRIGELLAGSRKGVISLNLRPGDLQVFKGRHSLHRVTRLAAGSRPRHAAIFAYTEQDNVIGRLERTQQLFGRALPQHEAAEVERVRHDELLD